MSELSAANLDAIYSACLRNQPAIADSLNRCFGTKFPLSIGALQQWYEGNPPPELKGPGLLVTLQVGERALLLALPVSLPLPAWYAAPGPNEKARLETLPMEWTLSLLPEGFVSDEYSCQSTDNLLAAINLCEPVEGAGLVPFVLQESAESATSAPAIWMIWPVSQPLPAVLEDQPPPAAVPPTSTKPATAGAPLSADEERTRRIRQILKLPVPVIVKLAEKRILLGQLMDLGPGAIVTFDKPCEELLDLCVNNQVYCRGEAVKIGEKFGLKVNEIGSYEERRDALRGRL